jgi:hypothetical protein
MEAGVGCVGTDVADWRIRHKIMACTSGVRDDCKGFWVYGRGGGTSDKGIAGMLR